MNNPAFQSVLRDLRAAHPAVTFVGYFRTPKVGCCIKLDAAGHGGRALTAIITEARVAAHTGAELIEPEWAYEIIIPPGESGTVGHVALTAATQHALELVRVVSRAYWEGRRDEVRLLEALTARRERILTALVAHFGPLTPTQAFNIEVGLNIVLKQNQPDREFVWGGAKTTQRSLITSGLLVDRAEHLLTATAQFTSAAVAVITATE